MINFVIIISSLFISGTIFGTSYLLSLKRKKKAKTNILKKEFESISSGRKIDSGKFEMIYLKNEEYLASLYSSNKNLGIGIKRKVNSDSNIKPYSQSGIVIVNKSPLARTRLPIFK